MSIIGRPVLTDKEYCITCGEKLPQVGILYVPLDMNLNRDIASGPHCPKCGRALMKKLREV